jgi:hypothetical protein
LQRNFLVRVCLGIAVDIFPPPVFASKAAHFIVPRSFIE